MKKENLNLKLIVEEDGQREAINLSGIPRELWDSFVKRCANHLEGEEPETAWSKVFAGVIQSEFITKEVILPYLKSQKAGEYTFLLAGIPLQARDALDMYTSQANLTPDLLIALIYQAASTGSVHILNMKPPDEHSGYHVLINTGVTDEVWTAWSSLADKMSEVTGEPITPEDLMGYLLERVLWGDVNVTSTNPDLPGEEKGTPENGTIEHDVDDLKSKLDKIMQQMNKNAQPEC